MARKPTPAEIRETNPNVTKSCDSCQKVMTADEFYGTFENMLTFKVLGGYMEYVDTVDPDRSEYEFNLCHKCGHKLMDKFFPHYDLSHWHEKTAEKFCKGWISSDWRI